MEKGNIPLVMVRSIKANFIKGSFLKASSCKRVQEAPMTVNSKKDSKQLDL